MSRRETTTKRKEKAMKKPSAMTIRNTVIILDVIGIFKISASHIYHVALAHGNSAQDAMIYPAAIDALILVSALTLIARKGVNRTTKNYAKIGRVLGFAGTIYCNMLNSGWSSTDSVVVNLIPAVSLIIVMELAIHSAMCSPGTTARKAPAKTK